MPQQPPDSSSAPHNSAGSELPAATQLPVATQLPIATNNTPNASQGNDLGPADRVQWFGRPDAGEKPLGFWRLLVITMSGHVGVRSRANRHEDFRRANGLHVFIAAVVYFVLIISALIALTNFIVSN